MTLCKNCNHEVQLFSCVPTIFVHSRYDKKLKYLEVHKYCMYGKCKCKTPRVLVNKK